MTLTLRTSRFTLAGLTTNAGVSIPWTSWLQTGDTSIIEQNWEAMQKYLRAIEEANPDLVFDGDFYLTPKGHAAAAQVFWDTAVANHLFAP